MPHTQQQYQVRFATTEAGELSADLLCWVDVFGLAPAPAGVARTVTFRNRAEAARWIVAEQERRQARTSVLVIAAGSAVPGDPAIENLIAAGALIAALSELGLDHTSPEAAAALATWLGVQPAFKHLLGATAAAKALKAAGESASVTAALTLDVD